MQNHFIILSSIEWNTIWQTQQKLAISLSKKNNVLFVENTGVRSPRIKDVKRIRERFKNWIKSTGGFRQYKEKLLIYYPIIIPLPYSLIIKKINQFLILRSIKKWLKIHNSGNLILITFIPSPLSISLIEKISPNVLIYYCANQMSGHNKEHNKLLKWENKLLHKSDSVFVISELLKENALKYNKNVKKFPGGVEFERYEEAFNATYLPEKIKNLKEPIVGYIGAITEIFDMKLVEYVVSHNTDYTFIFIGPRFIDCSKLSNNKNVILLDQINKDELPYFMKKFNVGIIPYVVNDFTNNVYSSKLNEYLSLGIPVVSTNLHEISHFNLINQNVIDVAFDEVSFSNYIKKNIQYINQDLKVIRRNVAKSNSWENRFKEINSYINLLIEQKPIFKNDWKTTLQKMNMFKKGFVLKAFFLVVLIYFIIFKSPLFWYLGDNLVLRDKPQKTEAIVIFSGNGEPAYQNPSYQKRALDGIEYFNQGLANKIFLTSGRVEHIREIKLIESIMLSNGVPKESIVIVNEYPKNTYENVLLTNKYLKLYNINKILFITAPYHSLRSNLIWKSNFDYIEVNNPSVLDTPSAKMTWGTNISQIKVITYEYLAIIYNWYKGYIKF
ncbi:YdcF family protein [Alphaproteobacteria bacterium]|nr:YdcF family protein [Alphaproteobacteria bacterium]